MGSSGAKSVICKHVMEEKVHKWFASLSADEIPVEDFLSSNARLFDNLNQVNAIL